MSLLITPAGRLYHTGTGRFLSRDPGKVTDCNPYEALANNPEATVDPDGAAPLSVTWDINSVRGTATARKGAMVWDLARALTGSGTNWRRLLPVGNPNKIQIGTTIDISAFLFPLIEKVHRFNGSVRLVVECYRRAMKFCCPDTRRMTSEEMVEWFLKGTEIVGGTADMAGTTTLRIAAVLETGGETASGFLLAARSYRALKAAARHDFLGTIQEFTGASVASLALLANPLWAGVGAVGVLGEIVINLWVVGNAQEEEFLANEGLCQDYLAEMRTARRHADAAEHDAAIAWRRLKELGLMVP